MLPSPQQQQQRRRLWTQQGGVSAAATSACGAGSGAAAPDAAAAALRPSADPADPLTAFLHDWPLLRAAAAAHVSGPASSASPAAAAQAPPPLLRRLPPREPTRADSDACFMQASILEAFLGWLPAQTPPLPRPAWADKQHIARHIERALGGLGLGCYAWAGETEASKRARRFYVSFPAAAAPEASPAQPPPLLPGPPPLRGPPLPR